MTEAKSIRPSPFYHVVMTSLFYPAVLGVIFYSVFQNFTLVAQDHQYILLAIASIGIVISFTVDFLYTYSSAKEYPIALFACDIVILFFLFLAYDALVSGIQRDGSVVLFFISYTVIHGIFLAWDLTLIPKKSLSKTIVAFDATGFAASVAGLALFRESVVGALVLLWCLAIFYVWVGWKEIVPRLLPT